MKSLKKLVRITTVPLSMNVLLKNQLRYMSEYYEVKAVSSPGKLLDEVSKREGVETVPVLMTRAITPIGDLKALWKLYRLMKKEQPLIVHTHTPKAGLLGMLAAKLARVPIRLHTVAGMPLMESTGTKRKILEFTEKLTYNCATRVYPNSKNLSEFIIKEKFCKTSKLKVLGNGSSNGIDTNFFKRTPDLELAVERVRKEWDISPEDFVFVFVGRLVRDKGIEELVTAFDLLKKDYKNIKLLLVGPYEPELDPLSDRTHQIIRNDSDIISAGFQPDIRPFLAVSNALAFPSYREGFPNVPMQAGCFELPSIVTDINGCNEIIEHGKNGLIIPVKDHVSLLMAMEALLTDKKLYYDLKINSRRMIVDRYEQRYFWSLLLREYRELENLVFPSNRKPVSSRESAEV